MASLHYELNSEGEIDDIWDSDEDAGALIDELLCQFEENPSLLDELCVEHSHQTHDPSFQVKRFQHMWNKGYTMYTLKIWPDVGQAIKYRVLYAHHPQKDAYHILTVMPREINYDSDKELIAKLIEACEDIGIPRHK